MSMPSRPSKRATTSPISASLQRKRLNPSLPPFRPAAFRPDGNLPIKSGQEDRLRRRGQAKTRRDEEERPALKDRRRVARAGDITRIAVNVAREARTRYPPEFRGGGECASDES